MEVVGEAYDAMVGTRREMLVVEPGTGDSVQGYDRAYRKLVVQNASEYGVEVGDLLDVEVTGHNTVYAFAEPA
jgi:tRNA A37 methylthiotransferase MiaB